VVASLQSVALATSTKTPVLEAAAIYLGLAEALGLSWLQQQVERLHVEGEWAAMARASLRDQLHELLAEFSTAALTLSGGDTSSRLARWQQHHATGVEQLQRTLTAMRAAGNADFATLSVALQAVRRVV
jgi:glutamate dehydrogenase